MDWIRFFFGWLIKGQYESSVLDGIIFIVEFFIVVIIVTGVRSYLTERKLNKNVKKKKKR